MTYANQRTSLCDRCQLRPISKGAVIDGKFGHYCDVCLAEVVRVAHGGHAQYQRDRDIDAHAKDILTPWTRRGVPSKEFIREYPDEAKNIFSQEELEQYG